MKRRDRRSKMARPAVSVARAGPALLVAPPGAAPLLLFAMTAALATACGGGSQIPDRGDATGTEAGIEEARPARPDAAPLTGHNLLLITLDTLRADRLGAYGHDAAETPHIDALAAEGVRFERVTTTVPVTLPAHASIMTGRQPYEHGVRNNGAFVLGPEAVTLAEVLRAAGYATGGFIGAVVLDAQFGIAQGFETFDGLARYQAQTGDRSGERPGGAVVDQAIAWIEAQSGPWLAWVHLYDAHDPYEPPEPWASRHADDPYDGEVAYVDAMVGRLRQALADSGAAHDTLVVLTADHGEGLGDHGEQGHGFFVYDATVRVPLIFWAPPAVPRNVTVDGGAGVVDIFPTVLALLGVAPGRPAGTPSAGGNVGGPGEGALSTGGVLSSAGEVAGVDLSPRFNDPRAAGTATYAESLLPYLDFGWSELRALVDGNYKYIAAPEPELYDLAADPAEAANLVDVEVERADAMAARLAELVAGDDVTAVTGVTLDNDDRAALQALGYLAGGGPARDRRNVDPKDMVETYEAFIAGLNEVTAAIDDGRYGDANETLVQLDVLMPEQYIVHYYFGRLAREAGDPQTAVAALERALELEPSYLPTYTQLANALYAAGDADAALDLIAQAQAMFPDNFSLTLLRGAIAHDAGDLDDAHAAYRAAARLEPEHPELLERLGHLHLLRREPRDAVLVLRRLVEVTPQAAPAWAQLAFALASTGDTQAAGAALERALALDSADPLVQQIARQLR